MKVCRKCKAEATKNTDKTPGAFRAWYECACKDGRPMFPLAEVKDRR